MPRWRAISSAMPTRNVSAAVNGPGASAQYDRDARSLSRAPAAPSSRDRIFGTAQSTPVPRVLERPARADRPRLDAVGRARSARACRPARRRTAPARARAASSAASTPVRTRSASAARPRGAQPAPAEPGVERPDGAAVVGGGREVRIARGERAQPVRGQDVRLAQPRGRRARRLGLERVRPQQPAELRAGARHRHVAGLQRHDVRPEALAEQRPQRGRAPASTPDRRSACAAARSAAYGHRLRVGVGQRRLRVGAVGAHVAAAVRVAGGVDRVAPALLRRARPANAPGAWRTSPPPASSVRASQSARRARPPPRARARRWPRARRGTTPSRRPCRSSGTRPRPASPPRRTTPAARRGTRGRSCPAPRACPVVARVPGVRRARAASRARSPGRSGSSCSEVISASRPNSAWKRPGSPGSTGGADAYGQPSSESTASITSCARSTTVSVCSSSTGAPRRARSRASSRSAASAPPSRSGWRIVVRPTISARSTSSKPITATSSRDAHAEPLGGLEHADRLQVGGGEDRARRVGERQQLLRQRLRPRRARAGRSARAPGPCAHARALQRGAEPEPAILARREAVRVGRDGLRRTRSGGGRARAGARPASSPPRTLSITTRGSARVDGVDEHRRQLVALERGDLGVGDRQRDDQQPGHAVAAGEVAQRAVALLGRLDVEQHQVVLAPLAAPEPLDHAAQPFDHRRRGEERHDDADRHRAPDREVARGRVEAVAELVDRGLHARPRRLDHERAVVDHARDRRDAHAGMPRHVPDRRSAARAKSDDTATRMRGDSLRPIAARLAVARLTSLRRLA